MKIKPKLPAATPRIAVATLGLCFLFLLRGLAIEPPAWSNFDRILDHVRYLASDELMGRGVDTPGIELARDYIAREFRNYGLLPGGEKGSYFQSLDVVTGVKVRESSAAHFGDSPSLILNEEWVPLGLSGSGNIEGEVVFVGYGITDKDYGYDDYANADVKGKIVVILRYEPPPKNEKSPFQRAPRYSRHATLRSKAINARDHGAVGMILVDLDPLREGENELIPLQRSLGSVNTGLIAVQIQRAPLDRTLHETGLSLSELKNRIDLHERPASTPVPGLRASLTVTLEKITKRTDNVIGFLPGSDPRLNKENVVIGAHYDHLGLGYFGTRDRSTEGEIHNGADDNASGTAVLMNLAQRLSSHPRRLPRTIVFIAFTGEELGLYGSRRYVNDPLFPLSSTRAMVNLDMVGRMQDNRVTVFGIDTAKEFRSFVSGAAQEVGVAVREASGVGRSDHVSFYNKNIPFVHFFTGTHNDYHRPTDDWEKLNIQGMVKVSDLVLNLAEKMATVERPLTFARLPSRADASPTFLRPAPKPE